MSETFKFVRVDETLVTGGLYGSDHRSLLGVILEIEKPTKDEVIDFLAKNGERVDMGTLSIASTSVIVGGSSGTFGHPEERDDVDIIRRSTADLVRRDNPGKTVFVFNP